VCRYFAQIGNLMTMRTRRMPILFRCTRDHDEGGQPQHAQQQQQQGMQAVVVEGQPVPSIVGSCSLLVP
jgi:hypothetical protein